MRQVTAAILEKDGKILIAQRKRASTLGGKWEFPGGKIEEGETPEQCLKRELKEEFDIDVEVGDFICCSKYVYPHIAIKLLVYKTRHLSGDIKLNDHDEVAWVYPQDFGKYDFVEADKPIATKIIYENASASKRTC